MITKFELTDKQLKKLEAWRKKSKISKSKHIEPIEPNFSFTFDTTNGIGPVIVVKNLWTDEELDLTDFNSW